MIMQQISRLDESAKPRRRRGEGEKLKGWGDRMGIKENDKMIFY